MTEKETIEKCAAWVESYSKAQIRMACGEMTAQEMRTVLAVQRWWVSALRHIATQGFEHFPIEAPSAPVNIASDDNLDRVWNVIESL